MSVSEEGHPLDHKSVSTFGGGGGAPGPGSPQLKDAHCMEEEVTADSEPPMLKKPFDTDDTLGVVRGRGSYDDSDDCDCEDCEDCEDEDSVATSLLALDPQPCCGLDMPAMPSGKSGPLATFRLAETIVSDVVARNEFAGHHMKTCGNLQTGQCMPCALVHRALFTGSKFLSLAMTAGLLTAEFLRRVCEPGCTPLRCGPLLTGLFARASTLSLTTLLTGIVSCMGITTKDPEVPKNLDFNPDFLMGAHLMCVLHTALRMAPTGTGSGTIPRVDPEDAANLTVLISTLVKPDMKRTWVGAKDCAPLFVAVGLLCAAGCFATAGKVLYIMSRPLRTTMRLAPAAVFGPRGLAGSHPDLCGIKPKFAITCPPGAVVEVASASVAAWVIGFGKRCQECEGGWRCSPGSGCPLQALLRDMVNELPKVCPAGYGTLGHPLFRGGMSLQKWLCDAVWSNVEVAFIRRCYEDMYIIACMDNMFTLPSLVDTMSSSTLVPPSWFLPFALQRYSFRLPKWAAQCGWLFLTACVDYVSGAMVTMGCTPLFSLPDKKVVGAIKGALPPSFTLNFGTNGHKTPRVLVQAITFDELPDCTRQWLTMAACREGNTRPLLTLLVAKVGVLIKAANQALAAMSKRAQTAFWYAFRKEVLTVDKVLAMWFVVFSAKEDTVTGIEALFALMPPGVRRSVLNLDIEGKTLMTACMMEDEETGDILVSTFGLQVLFSLEEAQPGTFLHWGVKSKQGWTLKDALGRYPHLFLWAKTFFESLVWEGARVCRDGHPFSEEEVGTLLGSFVEAGIIGPQEGLDVFVTTQGISRARGPWERNCREPLDGPDAEDAPLVRPFKSRLKVPVFMSEQALNAWVLDMDRWRGILKHFLAHDAVRGRVDLPTRSREDADLTHCFNADLVSEEASEDLARSEILSRRP